MSKPKYFSGNTLYRIFYGEEIVYLGRTMQPLQDRIRGHVFGRPMHRLIDIELVTKIEYTTYDTQADMYLYEIYYINKYKPPLNNDDKAKDDLTVTLPEKQWIRYVPPMWDRWKEILAENKRHEQEEYRQIVDFQQKRADKRKEVREGRMSEEDFYNWVDETEKLRKKYNR